MIDTLKFEHGFYGCSYEQQANEQGHTLGTMAEYFEDVAHVYSVLLMEGFIGKKQAENIEGKIQKKILKSLKPLPNPSKE